MRGLPRTPTRGCLRRPATIPAVARCESCHSRSPLTPSALATSSFLLWPSHHSRIPVTKRCAFSSSSALEFSKRLFTDSAGFGTRRKCARLPDRRVLDSDGSATLTLVSIAFFPSDHEVLDPDFTTLSSARP